MTDAMRQSVAVQNIPAALKERPHWLCWRLEQVNGRWTKVPYRPFEPRRKAKSNDPATWGTFAQAIAYWEAHPWVTGIGIAFADDLVGVDLDHCIVAGEIQPWAADILSRLNTYGERSPSGTGVHCLALGSLPPGRHNASLPHLGDGCRIEMYDARSPKYFTVTGNMIGDYRSIEHRQAELAALHAEYLNPPKPGARQPPAQLLPLADEEILTKAGRAANAAKFRRLFNGDLSDYGGDHSAADLALCAILAFYSDDPNQVDRIFRRSALFRPKWDERHSHDGATYGALTIAKAMAPDRLRYGMDRQVGCQPTAGRQEIPSAVDDPEISSHTDADQETSELQPERAPDPLLPLGEAENAGDRVAEAQAVVEAALQQAAEDQDPGIPFDIADDLADLPQAAYARAKSAFKKALGRALNLRQLDQTVEQSRRRHAAEARSGERSARRSGLPEIMINNRQLREVAQDALAALQAANEPPVFFVRSGSLVRLRFDEKQRPLLDEVNVYHVRHRLTSVADFCVFTTGEAPKVTGAFPPLDVARDLLARGYWPFPPVEAIIETPVLRRDGSVLDRPGYDPQTHLIYVPAPDLVVPPIPDRPGEAEIAAALATIDEAIGEFPFQDDASKANTIGLMVTAIVRPAIMGNVPLYVFDAPQPGTGKSLLSEVVAITLTGRPAAMTSADKSDEEWRKSITSLLLEGATFIVADNLQYPLWSPSLSRAVTARVWKDRLLSTNQALEVNQNAIWVVNGNQVQLRGDLPRRSVRIRLNAKIARPWLRTGFKHPNLHGWVGVHRGEMVAALLTLARAWYARGQPKPATKLLGNFEEWTRIVGGILENANAGDFLGNLRQSYDQSEEGEADWETFLHAWNESLGAEKITTGDLARKLAEDPFRALREALPEARLIESFEKDKPGSFSRKLGRALVGKADVCFGSRNLHLVQVGKDNRSGSPVWQLAGDPAEAAS